MSDDALTADLVEVIAKLRRQLAAAEETWTDEKGTEWRRPTAWAYAQVCAAHESLRTQIAALKAELSASDDRAARIAGYLDDAEQQIAALKADAARYRLCCASFGCIRRTGRACRCICNANCGSGRSDQSTRAGR